MPRRLSPEELSRTGEHPEHSQYYIPVMARYFALHDMLHAYRIEEILLQR